MHRYYASETEKNTRLFFIAALNGNPYPVQLQIICSQVNKLPTLVQGNYILCNLLDLLPSRQIKTSDNNKELVCSNQKALLYKKVPSYQIHLDKKYLAKSCSQV